MPKRARGVSISQTYMLKRMITRANPKLLRHLTLTRMIRVTTKLWLMKPSRCMLRRPPLAIASAIEISKIMNA